jgi:hypothetical protein
VEEIAEKAKVWAAVLTVSAAALGLGMPTAGADEATAKQLFKAMSDYLAAQKTISLDYDSNLEIVTTEKQKIGLASSGTLTLKRPDQVRATRTGGFADVELGFRREAADPSRQEREYLRSARGAGQHRSLGRRVAGKIPSAGAGGRSFDVGSRS